MDAPLAPAPASVAASAATKSIAASSLPTKPIAVAFVKAPPAAASSTDDDDPLLTLVRRAFPDERVVDSDSDYEVLGRVKQANAEGARVRVRFSSSTALSSGGAEDAPENAAANEERELFVKRVDAALYAPTKKGWADLRRTLMYARTEVRFYAELLPLLEGGGSSSSGGRRRRLALAPHCHLAECDLSGLIGDDEAATDVSHGKGSSAGAGASTYVGRGGSLVLSSIDPSSYYQRSPLTVPEASACLAAVADLHAAAWENRDGVLAVAADRLSENGGSYHLHIRNPKELENMEESWDTFRENFRELAPEVLDRPSVVELGRRMKGMAPWVCDALSPGLEDPYATVVHGDFKAMNVFLPKNEDGGAEGGGAVMIDFASVGVGMAMSDVAMHVAHAVRPEDLADGGEERLVDGYLDALHSARVAAAAAAATATSSGVAADVDVEPYPRRIAHRHYRLASVDYFRFILGRFYGSATPDQFEAKKDLENRTLVNRDLRAAVAFVARVDRYLAEFEEEREKEGRGGE